MMKYKILILVLFYSTNIFAENNTNNKITFSQKGGFYTSPFHLKISSYNGDTIYYTLNGAIPTENSYVFTDPLFLDYKYSSPNIFSEIPTTPKQSKISYKAWESPKKIIDKANILRCATYKNGIITSEIYTQTFFIDSLIFEKYVLPVISLITDSLNLFAYDNGIYVPGKHFDSKLAELTGNYFYRGEKWERPVHIEYFEKNGAMGFSQNAGIRIHGGITRHASQKSLRLYARNEYGEKYFNYQLMPQSQNDKYKRFLLRTTMGAWELNTILNDVLAQNICKNLNIEYQNFQPVVVFLNGEYWGIHTIRDRIDERFIEYTYDIDKDSIDLISGDLKEVSAGSNEHYLDLLEFIKHNDLFHNSNYEYVKTQIDIENYIDYQIAEIFFANYDWPGFNTTLWRPQTRDGKWRWILYDLDGGFYKIHYNMFEHSTKNDSDIDWPNPPKYTFLFRKLLKNQGFTAQFIKRFAEVLNNDFQVNKMLPLLYQTKELYDNEMPRHISRWNFPNSFSSWEKDINERLLEFLIKRPCNIRKQIIKFFNIYEFDFTCNTKYENNDSHQDFVIAPNPSDGIFTIINKSPLTINGNLIIMDITGKNVYLDRFFSFEEGGEENISLSNLPSNIYLLNFFRSDFLVERHNIIIIR